jgi:hypothetical protein
MAGVVGGQGNGGGAMDTVRLNEKGRIEADPAPVVQSCI